MNWSAATLRHVCYNRLGVSALSLFLLYIQFIISIRKINVSPQVPGTQTITYPANFTLIAATNPCPCGYHGSNDHYCTCTPNEIRKYQLKASGPLLDRLDFQLSLQSVHLTHQQACEDSEKIRQRTTIARKLQRERYQNNYLNSTAPSELLIQLSHITKQQLHQLSITCFNQKWSHRTQLKIIRIARTIADLEGTNEIPDAAMEEAIAWKIEGSQRDLVKPW